MYVMHIGTHKLAAMLVLYGFFFNQKKELWTWEKIVSILEEHSVIIVLLISMLIWSIDLCLCITDSSQRSRIFLGLQNP